jgi:transglutaminase-like putative cysteine protease
MTRAFNILALAVTMLFGRGIGHADGSDPPLKWGEVPLEQLKMTSYPPDSNASALILCDYGEVHFDDEYNIVYTRHRRIKIFTKGGFEWGTHSVSYHTKDRTQRVRDLEGMTITLRGDGTISTTELDDESVFEEDVTESWERVRFTLPALTEGCVVEYRYTIESESPHYMPDWEFQTSEPALWSEFRVKIPNVFGYAVLTQGYERFFVNESEVTKQSFRSPRGLEMVNVASARWVIKDVPAIREEPFMTTVDDYLAKVTFQLSIVSWPGIPAKKILQSWDEVVEELLDFKRFGGQLSGFSDVRKQTETIVAGMQDSMQKAVAIYDFVRNTIVWNQKNRVYVENDVDEVLESKSGSSAEVNLLLCLMLRHAGLSANPVLLSTRNNGKVYTAYPMINQFNYVITQLRIGQTTLFLDATDRFRPFRHLPVQALNQNGLSIDEDGYSWAAIQPVGKGLSRTMVTATLSVDGAVKGTVQKSFSDYTALSERKSLADMKEDEYVKKELGAEESGMSIDSFTISNKDSSDKPLILEVSFTAASLSQVLDDFIYVNPTMVDRTKENPFKLANRTFPVDYAYPREASYTLLLTLPAGYVLKEIPREISLSLQQGIGRYTRRATVENNVVQLRHQFELSKVLIASPFYKSLREFYDRIVSLEAEQLVLQRSGPTGSK